MAEEKKFSPEELARHDGGEGRPVYVAHGGRVIDVTASKLWRGGRHMNRHQAGQDLTEAFKQAPHGREVLDRYPQVGTLGLPIVAPSAAARPLHPALAWLLERAPLLQRHPHPMLVHFPIVFNISATILALLHLATGSVVFDHALLVCLGGSLLYTPLALATGVFSWWLNYLAQPIRPVKVKLLLTPLLLYLAATLFLWRLLEPTVLTALAGWGWLFLVLVLSLAPLVSVIGWYGASMTFPTHED